MPERLKSLLMVPSSVPGRILVPARSVATTVSMATDTEQPS